ncbi:MAG TPA: hypothetical protein VHU85_04510 [Acidimicrobiales bacterium]|nr:hypothetical protein [Acidimicrobiales bacterium]
MTRSSRLGGPPVGGKSRRSGLRNYRRTLLALILFAATTVTVFATAPGGASADTGTFYPGTSTATASALSLVPSTGGLGYTITFSTSNAEYEQGLAKALSQTLNLGVIGTILTTASCNMPAAVPASALPQPVSLENNAAPPTKTLTVAGTFNGSGAGAGVEQASVTGTPSASSSTRGGDFAVAGAIDLSGLNSAATAGVVNNQTRSVDSSVDIGSLSLLGGLVVLKGLHWEASQQSGAANTSAATFAMGAAVVAGVTLPTPTPAQLATVIGIVNTALSPTGFRINLPAVTQTANAHDGNGATTKISPLSIGIDSSALGAAVIGSQLTSAQPLKTAIDNALIAANCQLSGDLLPIGDIALGVPAGGGGLDVDLGGATVNINADPPVNAFGSFGLSGNTAPSDTGGSTGTFTPGDAGTPFIPGTSGTSGLSDTSSSTPSSSGPSGAQSLGPTTKTSACASLSSSGGSCSGGGAAVWIALIALGLLLAAFAWDFVRQRRRRLTIGETL